MATQRAENDDRPRRRWWRRGGSAAVSHAGGHAASPAVNHATGHAASHVNGHDVSHADDYVPGHASGHANGHAGSHARSHAGSHATSPDDAHWDFGDSLVHPEIDGIPAMPTDECALIFIGYLQQHPSLREYVGRYISTAALRRKYYPGFVKADLADPIPYRTMAAALGQVTDRRERQVVLMRRGKRKRCTVTEYLIPRP